MTKKEKKEMQSEPEKITHKELTPLNVIENEKKKFNVDDSSFQNQYLSLDHFYGFWCQGGMYEETQEKYFSKGGVIDSEMDNYLEWKNSSFLKYSDHFLGLWDHIENHVNKFRGLVQWDVLVSYYLIFSINEIFNEVLDSNFLDEQLKSKMKDLIKFARIQVWPDEWEEKDYAKTYREIRYYFLKILTFAEIAKIDNLIISKLDKNFIEEYLDYIKQDNIAKPDKNSLSDYLENWNIYFKSLAVLLKNNPNNLNLQITPEDFANGFEMDYINDSKEYRVVNFTNILYISFYTTLVPDIYEWENLKKHTQKELDIQMSSLHKWRLDSNKISNLEVPEELMKLANDFK